MREILEEEFSEYDFLRLYSAITILKGLSPVIINEKLEKQLFRYYNTLVFMKLFENVYDKGKGYVNLNKAFKKAYEMGLMQISEDSGELRSIINCSTEEAKRIMFEYDEEYIGSMSKLIYLLSNSSNKQKTYFERIMIGNGDSAFFANKKNGERVLIGEGENSYFITVGEKKTLKEREKIYKNKSIKKLVLDLFKRNF